MRCKDCGIETINLKAHGENPWACINALKQKNARLIERIEQLEADLHATEAIMEVAGLDALLSSPSPIATTDL